ncbi:MAG: carbohydrate kinase [Acidimicrobiia bacterium]
MSTSVEGRGVVVVCGEALVDLVVMPDGTLVPHLGGGPYNAARTAARLGAPTAFLGRVSNDRFGEQLVAGLAAEGVDTSTIVRSEEPTMLALAEIGATGGASYRFYVGGTATPGLTAADALARLPATVSALCVGTLGLVLEPMAAASEAVVLAVHRRAPVLVDPNIRPALIADRAHYLERLARILAGADVVKLSDEDLAWIDADNPEERAVAAMLDAGPRVVVLTRGARGVSGFTAAGRIDVDGRAVQVADTIGAGDSVAGAILTSLHEHGAELLDDRDGVAEMLRFATRVAAITVSRPGADPPHRGELGRES